MILFATKPVLEIRKYSDGSLYPCRAFRWALQVHKDTIEWVAQHEYLDELGVWHSSHTDVFALELWPTEWDFGQHHAYYDGPHCSLALGLIRINYSGWAWSKFGHGCKKCRSDDLS